MTTRKPFQEETMTPTPKEAAEAVRDSYPERAVEAAAWTAHRQFWLDSYGDETGTAEKVAKGSWTPKAQERRRSEMRAALAAALPLLGVMRREDVARGPVEIDKLIAELIRTALSVVWHDADEDGEPYEYARATISTKFDAILRRALPHAGQPVEGLRGDSKRGPSLEAFGALLQEAVDWHDNQAAMADGVDCAESAQYHDTERKKYQAAIAALSATETAAVKNLVLASAALIADWSADCKVEDATIVKLLEAYNAIGSQRLLLSEVERELAPASPQPPVKPSLSSTE